MDPNARVVHHDGWYPLAPSRARTTTAYPVPALTPLDVLARAEKRLTSHIAARGIDADALLICATYERLYSQAIAPASWPEDSLTRLLDAVMEVA